MGGDDEREAGEPGLALTSRAGEEEGQTERRLAKHLEQSHWSFVHKYCVQLGAQGGTVTITGPPSCGIYILTRKTERKLANN